MTSALLNSSSASSRVRSMQRVEDFPVLPRLEGGPQQDNPHDTNIPSQSVSALVSIETLLA